MLSKNPSTHGILKAIASKGGTTEAALKELKKKSRENCVRGSQSCLQEIKKNIR